MSVLVGVLLLAPAAHAAAATLSPNPAAQGTGGTVTLNGSGFAPNSTVTFTLDSTALTTNPSSVTTDSSGDFSPVTFSVPTNTSAGAHMISATDSSADTGSAPLDVYTVAVNLTQGVAGDGLTISGGGWTTPGDLVEVELDSQRVCQLTVSPSGDISGNQADNGCEVPAGLSAGSYSLTATDQNGAQATGDSFEIPVAASFTSDRNPAEVNSQVTFDASASTVAGGGSPNGFFWYFGDGQNGSGPGPTIPYSYTQAGTYTVTLIVSDAYGHTAQTTQQIAVEGPPTTQITMNPSGPTATGTPIQFDGTGSTAPNGTIKSYQWDFGDNSSSTLPSPSHAYATAGTYMVSLTVTDAAGGISTTTQPVTITDRPPIAVFNPTAATVLAGSNMLFDGTASTDPDGSISNYSWDFGDGGSSPGSQTSHKYMLPGTYTVTLTVTDNSNNTATVSHQITVITPPPIQTLILTPVATPAILSVAPASTARGGRVDLGERLFCPGPGPGCFSTISARSRASGRTGHHVITIGPNGSAELTFRLSKRALAALRKHHRLPVRLTIVVVRGSRRTTSVLSLTLRARRVA